MTATASTNIIASSGVTRRSLITRQHGETHERSTTLVRDFTGGITDSWLRGEQRQRWRLAASQHVSCNASSISLKSSVGPVTLENAGGLSFIVDGVAYARKTRGAVGA